MSPVGLVITPSAPEIPEVLDAPTGVELPCRTAQEDLWFSDLPADLERAKALCTDCPVRRACLAGALDRREFCGVWGGEILDRGVVIPRKRPRGRPSKADLARDAELAELLEARTRETAGVA